MYFHLHCFFIVTLPDLNNYSDCIPDDFYTTLMKCGSTDSGAA